MKKQTTKKQTSPPHSSSRPIRPNASEEKKFDPLGSYTGRCENKKEVPTQDADDL